MRLVGEVAEGPASPAHDDLVMVREIVQAVEIATQPLLEMGPKTRIRHISHPPSGPTPRCGHWKNVLRSSSMNRTSCFE